MKAFYSSIEWNPFWCTINSEKQFQRAIVRCQPNPVHNCSVCSNPSGEKLKEWRARGELESLKNIQATFLGMQSSPCYLLRETAPINHWQKKRCWRLDVLYSKNASNQFACLIFKCHSIFDTRKKIQATKIRSSQMFLFSSQSALVKKTRWRSVQFQECPG